jgi:hypothetical protein
MSQPSAIVPDGHYAGMFRLQWPDGVVSVDMYNRSRAHDHLRRWQETLARKRSRQSRAEASLVSPIEVRATMADFDLSPVDGNPFAITPRNGDQYGPVTRRYTVARRVPAQPSRPAPDWLAGTHEASLARASRP